MARKPRPIDPTDGPLQAFAYDLRGVREEAGNPTYRALAALAGFSATTLSDAAGGTRQPSLEVTLAYVGACGGDVRIWERRWRELERVLASEREATASVAGPKPPQPAPSVRPEPDVQVSEKLASHDEEDDDPVPRTARRQRWSRWAAVGAAAVLAAAVGLLGMRLNTTHRTTAATVPCPAVPHAPDTFPGRTYNVNTRIHSGASMNAPVVLQVPGGCTLEFTGYCLGDPVVDTTSGSPDMRWFELSGGGVVSSAVVHGNPPRGLGPSQCPDGVAPPVSVSLSVAAATDVDSIQLQAGGTQVGIVGFAAYYATGSGAAPGPKWHQLGFTASAATQFAVNWRLGPLRSGPAAQSAIPVAAVACLGGGGPTGVIDARMLQPAAPTTLSPASLAAAEQTAAEQTACGYPNPS